MGRAIVPFSSGPTPLEVAAVLQGPGGPFLATPSIVGFGSNVPVVSFLGGVITLTTGTEVFITPVPIMITDLTAQFITTLAVDLGIPVFSGVFIQVQLYGAPLGSTTYTPIGTPLQLLPPFILPITVGMVVTGSAHGLNIPIPEDTQLVLAINTAPSGLTIAGVITGLLHAGMGYRIAL